VPRPYLGRLCACGCQQRTGSDNRYVDDSHMSQRAQARAEKKVVLCACGCGRPTATSQHKYVKVCLVRVHAEQQRARQNRFDPEQVKVREQAENEPVTVRCARCGWSAETTGGEAAATFREHQAECSAALVAA
jgi:hypothetical protein